MADQMHKLRTKSKNIELQMEAIRSQMVLGQASYARLEALEEQKSPPINERPAAQMITTLSPYEANPARPTNLFQVPKSSALRRAKDRHAKKAAADSDMA